MKKLIALLLTLCLVFSLTACGGSEEPAAPAATEVAAEAATEAASELKVFEKTGFCIALPQNAEDISEEETAEVEPYMFSVDELIICAMEQKKDFFGYDMSAEEYAQLLIDSNEFPTTVSTKNGLPYFIYENDGMTFLGVVMTTDNALWFVNAACYSDDFAAMEDTMWQHLSTVEVYPTGAAPTTQAVVVEDLTIFMPAEGYEDVKETISGEFNFAFMPSQEIVVVGICDDKASVGTYDSVEAYAQDVILSNGLETEVAFRDGVPYFTYSSEDGQFTYMAAVHEGTNTYWLVQSYTYADRFTALENDMWQFISTCTVA